MANFNKVILAGNLTRSVVRFCPARPCGRFRPGLSITSGRTPQGEDREEAFHRLLRLRKMVETIVKYCQKGKLYPRRRPPKFETWDDKEAAAAQQAQGRRRDGFNLLW
jgi:single-stranded DNA-binding protein